ncbi:MAG: penicillin binding protein PBP4B [Lachnospiraceae bacterium]|nr:penicillin binding protein PBP4B [Lachnospiraceae bacterium]
MKYERVGLHNIIKGVTCLSALLLMPVFSSCNSLDTIEPEEALESLIEADFENIWDKESEPGGFPEETETIIHEFPRGDIKDSGIHEEAIALMEAIIEKDVEYGFPGAEVSIIKDNKLIYEKAFGYINRYDPEGSLSENPEPVSIDTLFDLASITKMFSVNYALQRLVTEDKINIDSKVYEYLGPGFYEDVIYIDYTEGDSPDLNIQKEWKKNLRIRDLLMHRGGFPADPRYFNPHLDTEKQNYSRDKENLLFAGSGADEATKKATIEAICKTPLLYEPGKRTLYSDVDYMILGLIVEKVTGLDLDTYLKQEFTDPMGLKHISYEPLKHGFLNKDCAATELCGNTRGGYIEFPGIRTYTLQGEVHDEKAYYSMAGVSGHAGLFSNATDLSILASLMLTGEYNGKEYFSDSVIKEFTSPQSEDTENWGLGWWRQGDCLRPNFFGTKASENAIGHQGWTGTFILIDPDRNLIITILTNKINSPVTDPDKNLNKFDGSFFTTGALGFAPEIIYTGIDEDRDISDDLKETFTKIYENSHRAIKKGMAETHPAVLNFKSKEEIYVDFFKEVPPLSGK